MCKLQDPIKLPNENDENSPQDPSPPPSLPGQVQALLDASDSEAECAGGVRRFFVWIFGFLGKRRKQQKTSPPQKQMRKVVYFFLFPFFFGRAGGGLSVVFVSHFLGVH